MNIYLEAEKELAIALGYNNFQRFESNGMPVSGSVDGVVTPLKQWTRSSAAAFELAVEHVLTIRVFINCVVIETHYDEENYTEARTLFKHFEDRFSAVRYAVVQAVIAKLKG